MKVASQRMHTFNHKRSKFGFFLTQLFAYSMNKQPVPTWPNHAIQPTAGRSEAYLSHGFNTSIPD
jgi:hypothetical protein